MKEMRTTYRTASLCTAAALVLAAVLSGCRKELCYDHNLHGAYIRVLLVPHWERVWERGADGISWEDNWPGTFGTGYSGMLPEVPEGIRVVAFQNDVPGNQQNLPPEGDFISLNEGESSILLYNNDTEYIVFDGLDGTATATATTRTKTRATYSATHPDETTIGMPDMLYGSYIDSYTAERTIETVELHDTLRPLTYTYYIRFEITNGLERVAAARGTLAGMAAKVYLMDGHTDEETAGILFDGTVEDWGAEARVLSFGVPGWPGIGYRSGEEQEVERQYGLNLELELTSGTVVTGNFDEEATLQIAGQPRGGVIVIRDIDVDDLVTIKESGGFDVDVDDWKEGDTIELPDL